MDGFQAFNKLNLPQRHFERRALAARGLPRSSALESHSVKKFAKRLELFAAGYVADCGDALNHFDPITQRVLQQSFYRPGACRIFRRYVFLEQLFCQLHILLRNLQPHTADDFTGKRMHAMHVLIAQETVYPTRVQQTLGDVRFMQVIENSGSGKLVWFPVWMHGYLPWKLAARFSRKAVVPSFLSSVAQHMPNSVASRKSPSGRVMFMPWFTASIQYWIASGAMPIIFCAISSARGMSRSAGTTSFTKPMRCASCAVIISPVSRICIASPVPTRRGSRCVPP